MKRCMYCGQENDDASTNCSKCGNELLEMPIGEPGVIEELSEENPEEYPQEVEVPDVQYEEAVGAPQEMPEEEYGYLGHPEDQQYAGQAYGYEQPPQAYEAEYGYYDEPEEEPAPVSSGLLMKKARRRIKSFFFFVPMICFTVYTIASILNVALGSARVNIATVMNTLNKTVGENMLLRYANMAVKLLDRVDPLIFMAAMLVMLIPAILMMFGMWMAFCGTSTRRRETSTAGITMTKVGIVIKMILVCALLLAGIVLSVSYVVAAGAASSMMTLFVGIIVLLILVITTVFVILYYVQVMFALKVVKVNVRTGTFIGKIPGFSIFVNLLGCAVTVLCMLPMAPDDYIGLAAKGAYAAWLLFTSLWAVIYRATVKVK
ncbi:MAG: Yip1 family protein [Lachnospiraceae bacterium]|nr:Yip1 family protein [Lachnospiraceae bacterium]